MRQKLCYIIIAILGVTGLSIQYSYADSQVIIPLGASAKTYPFSLSPEVLSVKVNDTVTWQNQDNAIHTVTTGRPTLGFDGRFDSGPIQPGTTFSNKFTKPGVYEYYCLFHPWTTGLVNVGENTPVDKTIQITIMADKHSYKNGDTILISGEVSKFIPNEVVTVWISDEKGKVISTSHIETEDGSKFVDNIQAGRGLWVSGSSYKVFAQYGYRSSVATTTISFEPQDQQTVSSKSQNTNNFNATTDTNTSIGDSYFTSYKKIIADSNYFVTVQPSHYIYKPGDQVKIYGSIWNGVLQKVGGLAYLETVPSSEQGINTVSQILVVQIKDSGGKIVLNQKSFTDNNGDYSAIFKVPPDWRTGKYLVESTIQTKQGLLNAIDASISAKLGTSAYFTVLNPSTFVVKTTSGDLKVEIVSNSTISNFNFTSNEKKISFAVQGNTGTKGVTTISIPKNLVSGQIQVFIDGNLLPNTSDNVIVTSDNDTDTTLEINYHHSIHKIELIGNQAAQVNPSGTEVIPEFNLIATLVLGAALAFSFLFSIGLGSQMKIR